MQTEIGNWLLGEVIGEGGMGTVYLAHHKTLGTPAAFKVLAPALTRDPRFRERFVREAKAQAQLRHPGIAQVIDFIEQGDDLYLIMEYLPGGTLAELMEREKGPLPIAQSLAWTRRALSALDYAHRHGVIHRDVKPSNILFDENGQPKVVDFGIALILDGRRLTTTGTLGTPHYMSPEQIRRPQEVDHRTDVYAMGVVLYEMLAGRAPFDGESDFDIRYAQVNEPPKPLRPLNSEVSEELEAIIFRAMAKKADERISGCGEMERQLAALEQAARPDVSTNESQGFTRDAELLETCRAEVKLWKKGSFFAVIAGLLVVLVVFLVMQQQIREERNARLTQEAARESAEKSIKDARDRLAHLGDLTELRSWPLVVQDNFESGASWSYVNDKVLAQFGSGSRSILTGAYRWLFYTAKNFHWTDERTGTDFDKADIFLSVWASQVTGSVNASLGLIARKSGDGFYSFRVSKRGTYTFSLNDKGQWKTLRDWTSSSAIRQQGNRLAILMQGSRFKLFINDQPVDEITDDTLTTGLCGLAGGTTQEHDSVELAFSSFEVRQRPQ